MSNKQDSPSITSKRQEVTEFHTRLLRMSLGVEEARCYWEQWQAQISPSDRLNLAFEQRWFGNKSMPRVRTIINNFQYRFDLYPEAIETLHAWCPNDLITRQNINHWHLQFSDPLYREFTGVFLVNRHIHPFPTIDRDLTAKWLKSNIAADWASATTLRMATALITCTTAAGLCEEKGIKSFSIEVKNLKYPKVTDEALTYWLYFLRSVKFQGSLLENQYFASVGLYGEFLEQRLTQLNALQFRRVSDVHDFGWKYQDLRTWGKSSLLLKHPDALENLARTTK